MDCLFEQKLTVTGMIRFVSKDLESRIKVSNMKNPKLKRLFLHYNFYIYETSTGDNIAKDRFMNTVIIPNIKNKIKRFKDDNSLLIENWNISRQDDYNRKYTESELNEIKKYGHTILDPITKTIIFRNNDTGKEYFVETKLRSK